MNKRAIRQAGLSDDRCDLPVVLARQRSASKHLASQKAPVHDAISLVVDISQLYAQAATGRIRGTIPSMPDPPAAADAGLTE